MALFRPLLGEVSGSIANLVFLHGKAGSAIRSRSIPTNPTSIQQTLIRAAVQRRSQNWRTLGDSARAEWKVFALRQNRTNRLGEKIQLTAQQAYMMLNVRTLYGFGGNVALPPTTAAPDPPDTIAVAASSATQLITLTFTPTPLGANLRLVVRATPPKIVGSDDNFTRSRIQGVTSANPGTGTTLASRWRLTSGLRQNYYIATMDSSGQYSGWKKVTVTIT
jgi:hypothetical protein